MITLIGTNKKLIGESKNNNRWNNDCVF